MKYLSILKVLLVTLVALCITGMANAQVSLRFEPGSPTVGMGETTRVSLWLDEAIDIRTVQVGMAYDNSLLNSSDVGRGALWDAIAGNPSFFEGYDANSADGQWEGYTVSMGDGVYATGPGELMYWEVEGVTPGMADVTAMEVVLAAPDATEIPADFTASVIEVTPPFNTPVLDGEPEFTPGTENGTSWNDVGADEYQVQVSGDPAFGSVLDDSGWISGTSHTFTGLTDGQTYYYRVRGRVATPDYTSDWADAVESSTQDDLAPLSQVESLVEYQTTMNFPVPWSGSDATSGLASVELWVDGGSGYTLYDTITDVGTVEPFNFTAPTEGSYDFYTIANDDVGNMEAVPATADMSTTVDVTAPSGDLLVNGGATLTNDPSVTLTNTVTDAVQMRYINEGDAWGDWEAYVDSRAWVLTGADGLLTVTAQFRDLAGNVLETEASITLDTAPPVDSFVINDDDVLTNSTLVTLTMAGSDAAEMQFSNDGITYSDWVPYAASYDWTLETGEGDHTVYGQFRDLAQNVGQNQDLITLDTVPPVASFVINDDAEYSTSTAVVLTSTSTDAVQMQFSNDGVTYDDLVPYAGTFDWALAAVEGLATVHARYVDAAGNTLAVTDEITLDTLAPAATLVVNGDDAYTNSAAVVLTSTGADATEMQFSNDGLTYSGWVPFASPFVWDLVDVDGEATVYGQYRDLAGNVTDINDTIILDTSEPTGTMVINGDATYTNDTAVTLNNAIVDAVQMQFSADGVTYTGWVPYLDSQAWDLPAVEGEQTAYGQFMDAAGNVLTVSDSIILDTLAPVANFVINDDDDYATSTAVVLTNSSADAVQMQFSNDGVTFGELLPYAETYDWTLAAAEGLATVYAQYLDAAGNMGQAEDVITLDTLAPAASLVINDDQAFTSDTAVVLTSTSAEAVEMQFSNDGVTYAGWVSYAETYPWDLPAADGELTVYGQYRDVAGNITTTTDTIILDSAAPTGNLVINGGDALTSDVNVTLSNLVAGAVQMQFSNDNTTWSTLAPFADTYSWVLPDTDGALTVYGRFLDEAGNTLEAQDDITLDTTDPVGGFVINDDDALTNSVDVMLTSSVTGALEMRFTNVDGDWTAPESAWQSYSVSLAWSLASGDGDQTVFGEYRDAAGNTIAASDLITLDTVAPVASFVINNDEPMTNDANVALTVTSTDAAQMQFSNDGTTWSGWVAAAATYDWILSGADGDLTVHGQFRDGAGNVTETTDSIVLDTTAPEAGFVINDNEPLTNDPAVILTNTVTGVVQMQFSNDGSAWSGWTDYADTFPWTLSAGDGQKTVYGQFRDAADNVTEATDVITLDTTAPEATLVINDDAPYTMDVNVVLTHTVTGAVEMQLSADNSTWSDWSPIAATSNWVLENTQGEQTVFAQYRDAAGNISGASDAIILDSIAPSASFVINNDDPFTSDLAVVLTNSGADAYQMQFSNDGVSYSGWVAYEATYDWTLAGPDGELEVFGQFRDEAGNVISTSDTIILDTTAPDVPLLAGEPEFTQGTSNTLLWSDIGAAEYYIEAATDVAFGDVVANSGWMAGTDYLFTDLTDGQIYFYRVMARDDLGNETDWSASESSTQDAGLPISTVGPLDPFQTSLTFDVPWSGSDAVSGLASVELFVNDGGGWTSAGSTTEVDPPAAFAFTAPGEGVYSFYTVASDGVGLVETIPAAAEATTTVDVTIPEGTMAINGVDTITNDPAVTLDLAVTGAVSMRFSDDGSAWTDWEDYAALRTWTLPGPDGLLTVMGEFRDEAGNTRPLSADITLDTAAPEGVMVVNGDAALTNSPAVTLDLAVSGALEMQFSNDDATWSDWTAYADSYPWTLSDGDGLKTVFGQFRDEAGNVLGLEDDIELDTTAPAVPSIVAEPAFTAGSTNTVSWGSTGGTEYLAQLATDDQFTSGVVGTGWVTTTFFEFSGLSDAQTYYYRVMARDGLGNESEWSATVFSTQDATAPASTAGPLAEYQSGLDFDIPWSGSDATSGLASVELFVDDGSGWASFGSTTEVDPPAPFNFTATGEGIYRFYLVAQDVAGNLEGTEQSAEATTVVDMTAPAGVLAINEGDETTNDVEVVLHSDVSDTHGVVEMRFTNVDGDWPAEWLPYVATTGWTLPNGDGLHTVFGQYRDPVGNVFSVNDDITLDTTPPGMPSFLPEPEYTAGSANVLMWNDTGAAAYFVQMSDEEGFSSILTNSGWLMAQEFNFTGLADGQTYYYRLRSRDELGNETDWTDPIFSTQDATAPSSSADPMPTYQGMAEITVSWTGSDATSGLASVELFVSNSTEWNSAGVTTEFDPPVPFVYVAPEAGTYRFYTVATDVAGNVEIVVGSIDAYTTVDFSAPDAVPALDANPGLGEISLNWTNPEANDLAGVEVWAALWSVVPGTSAYPEYDDIADEPLRPGSRSAAEAAEEWVMVADLGNTATSFVHSEGMEERGVYYYEIFVKDFAGNYSMPTVEAARATNYLLGDFNGDNTINVFDITTLGATYGTAQGEPGYYAVADVGPTDDTTGSGVPLTDSMVEFEDLTIVALNYGESKSMAAVEGSQDPALTWYQPDENTWVLGLLEPCSSLKALNLVAEIPDGVTVTVESGDALSEDLEFFLANIASRGLDAGFAMLGKGRVLPVDGEILKVTTSEPVDLTQAVVRARDDQNEHMAVNLASEPIQVLPAAYRLASNYPNPFNPQTTISFDLPDPQNVRLKVYDLKGRLVKELVSGPMDAGSHVVVWNGTDRSDRRVASGVYFYQIQAGPLQDTKRMMLVK